MTEKKEKLKLIMLRIESLEARYDPENDLATGAMTIYDRAILSLVRDVVEVLENEI